MDNNLYQDAIKSVEDGETFKVDFEKKTLRVGNTTVDLNELEKDRFGIEECTTQEVFTRLEELYKQYKYSLPSKRSEKKKRKYFYSIPLDELPIEAMCCGIKREVAQIKLELWLLLNVVYGNIQWTDDLGKWYWHGKDKDLIVLKGWC